MLKLMLIKTVDSHVFSGAVSHAVVPMLRSMHELGSCAHASMRSAGMAAICDEAHKHPPMCTL